MTLKSEKNFDLPLQVKSRETTEKRKRQNIANKILKTINRVLDKDIKSKI